MNKILLALILIAFVFPSLAHAHGGGCMKDSMPSKCCHKDNDTGLVHCH